MRQCIHEIPKDRKCRPAQPAKPLSIMIRDLNDGGVRVDLTAEGESAERLDDARGEREKSVVEVLRSSGPRTPAALYEAMGGSERSAQRTLYRLARQGVILKWPDGTYRLTEKDAQLDLSEARTTRRMDGGEAECAAMM